MSRIKKKRELNAIIVIPRALPKFISLSNMDVTVLDEMVMEDVGLYNADELGSLIPSVSQNETANTNGGGGNTVYNLRGYNSNV